MSSSVEAHFGSGTLVALPSKTNPTPAPFGILQDVKLSISFDEKLLHGQRQFALKAARGKAKGTWDCKSAQFRAQAINDIFTNGTLATGQDLTAQAELHTPNGSYQITASFFSTYGEDLGVRSALTGAQFSRVASTPAVGQYTVCSITGVYTFNSADTGAVAIDYTYTTAGGNEITINNQLMGDIPFFEMVFNGDYEGNQVQLHLVKAYATKWDLPTKLDDFTIQDWSGGFIANDAGIVGYLSFTE